jgi:putative NADPH-quinone reductase
MSRRIVLIQGHPDPEPHHLCRALADAYAEGARAAGHRVVAIDVAALAFPLLRTQHAFEDEPVPESLRPAQQAIHDAQHLVLVFPLWLGTMPALLKGFLEQVARPGFAFARGARGLPVPLLKGRSARLVVTMGMPALVYRWWFHAHGVRGLERSVLRFAGIKPVRETLIGMVAEASAARRQRWLDRMRRLGAAAV